jgi:hypothetical protein
MRGIKTYFLVLTKPVLNSRRSARAEAQDLSVSIARHRDRATKLQVWAMDITYSRWRAAVQPSRAVMADIDHLVGDGKQLVRQVEPDDVTGGPCFLLPILVDHARALSERDLRVGPPQARGTVGGDRDVEVLDSGQVLDQVLPGVVPHVDAMGEIGLVLGLRHEKRRSGRQGTDATTWAYR